MWIIENEVIQWYNGTLVIVVFFVLLSGPTMSCVVAVGTQVLYSDILSRI